MAEHAYTPSSISPEATDTPLGRRRLGAGLFSIVLGTGITAGAAASVADLVPDNPDAGLLAICANAEAADDRSIAVWDAVAHLPAKDPRVIAAFDESTRIYGPCRDGMEQASSILAATPAGMRAKASLALREFSCGDEDSLPLVHSVLMQLAGRA